MIAVDISLFLGVGDGRYELVIEIHLCQDRQEYFDRNLNIFLHQHSDSIGLSFSVNVNVIL
jgi:hypothetical protein